MTAAVEAHAIAPLWKQAIASFLDSLPFFVLALPFVLLRQTDYARRRRIRLELAAMAFSGTYHISLTALHGQTLGQMAAGIRVVDEKTGATPSSRQSAVRWALTTIPGGLLRLAPVSTRAENTLAAMADLQPEIERLRQRHEGDRQKLNDALMALFEKSNVNPMDGCWPFLLRTIPDLLYSVALYGPALRGPLHQGLHDRVARTVVVQIGELSRPGA